MGSTVAVFDGHIKAVRDFMRSLPMTDDLHQELDWSGTPEELLRSLPINLGRGASSGIHLRSNTYTELGNPIAGSCSHLLWTNNTSLVRDGRITLIGPDIPASEGKSLPFGQILMLAGETLAAKDHERLQQAPIIGDRIEGYMLKSTSDYLWARISKDVAARGFNFEILGKSLISLIKSRTPGVTAVEILFVTSSKEDVKELASIASEVKGLGSNILKEAWKERGFDIECDFDCASCHDEPVCDDIREVIVGVKKAARKKKKAQDEASVAHQVTPLRKASVD
jgi:CO dehydrogenase/acetyl-CoA synthase beta subunit